jgi:hypothetical protein
MIIFQIKGKNQLTKIFNSFVLYKNIKSPIKKKYLKNLNKKTLKKARNIIINKKIIINNHNFINTRRKKKSKNKYISDKSNNLLNINTSNNKNKINIFNSNLMKKSKKKRKFVNKKYTKILTSKYNVKNNKINNKKQKYFYNDNELNILKYNEAIQYDKRTYAQYYCSLIKQKQILLFVFISKQDYNLFINKFSLFVISFSLYCFVNSLFFDNKTIHELYKSEGNLEFMYNILHIIYSTVISSFITLILKLLALSNKSILNIKKIKEKNKVKVLKRANNLIHQLIIRFNIYYFVGLLLSACFWYFISAFCAVYKNSQLLLLENTLTSYCLSLIYPFGLNLIPGIFRICALRAKNKDKNCLYIFSNIISIL